MTTEHPTIPPIDRVPEAPRVPCVLVGELENELENVLERPGDYVARAWSEEGGSESLAAWQGRALRELVRRHRSTAGSAPASVGPGAEPDEASTSDLPEVVYTNRAAWRRGPAGHYLRLGPDGRESVVALTLGQLAGLPGGVRVQPGSSSWCDEDALGRAAYEAFGADTPVHYLPWEKVRELLPELARRWREVGTAVLDVLPPAPSPPAGDRCAFREVSFEPYASGSGAGRWVFRTLAGIVVTVGSYDLDADVEARQLAQHIAAELR